MVRTLAGQHGWKKSPTKLTKEAISMTEWTVVAVLAIALIYLLWKYFRLKGRIESHAWGMFEEWREGEIDAHVDLRLRESEKGIREDAIRKSEAVIRGKVTETLIPFFPDFKYNSKDARFLGTPVDLVVFDGLSEGRMRKVVFIEVKTGRNAGLSSRERMVRDCIRSRRVTYEVIHHRDS